MPIKSRPLHVRPYLFHGITNEQHKYGKTVNKNSAFYMLDKGKMINKF
jgi:hypothetical protein